MLPGLTLKSWVTKMTKNPRKALNIMTITCTNLKTQQSNVYSQFLCKVSELQELCSMCNEKEADIRITTKKLAMVSLLTVFKDIIPG